jgi:Lon protease-like protein
LLVAVGVERIRVSEWLAEEPYPLATVETMPEVPVDHESGLLVEATARVRRTRALLSELGEQRPLPLVADLGDDPGELMWRLCAAAPVSLFDRQRLLVAEDPEARLSLLIEFCDEAAEDMTRMLAAGTPPDPSS